MTVHVDHPHRPSGRLRLARWAWIGLVGLTLILFFARLPTYFGRLVADADPRTLTVLRVSANLYAGYVLALYTLIVIAHLAPALYIFRRRSEAGMCLFVALTLLTNGALIPLSIMYAGATLSPVLRALLAAITYLGVTSSLVVLYLFPDGRFAPGWTRWLALVWAGGNGLGIFFSEAAVSLPRWPVLAQLGVLLAWSATGVYAQLHRYESVSTPAQRQQTKWAIVGLAAVALGPLVYYVRFVILPSLNDPIVSGVVYQRIGAGFFAVSLLSQLGGLTLFAGLALVFPLSFVIAIVRYRLWDIDVIIHRTLVYGAVTSLLTLIYFFSVVLLQAVFRALTGQGQNSLVTVASTLTIYALFFPLRQRVQAFIDKRFYRQKYDAAKVIAEFAATCRDETDLDKLTARLVEVAQETMQPEHVSLWLKPSPPGPLSRRPASGEGGGVARSAGVGGEA